MMTEKTDLWSDETKEILVIDDNVDLVQAMAAALSQRGYRVYTTHSCDEAMEHIARTQFDLVVLDAVLAAGNGQQGCGRIREAAGARVLMLAAQDSEEELLRGLQDGADDYLTKPFVLEQLLARTRVLLLLRSLRTTAGRPPKTYSDDYLTVNLADRRVTVSGELVRLTATEHRLLGHLLQNAGRAVSNEELLEAVWGPEHVGKVGYARIYAWRLRKKIERDAEQPEYILTEHGVGYRFEKAAAAARR